MEPLTREENQWIERMIPACREKFLKYIRDHGYYRELQDDDLHDCIIDAVCKVAKNFKPEKLTFQSPEGAFLFQFFQVCGNLCKSAVSRKRRGKTIQLDYENDIPDTRQPDEQDSPNTAAVLSKLLKIGREQLTPKQLEAILYHIGRGPYPRVRGRRIDKTTLWKRIHDGEAQLKRIAREEGLVWEN